MANVASEYFVLFHHKDLVAYAVEVRHRKPGTEQDKRKDAMPGVSGLRSRSMRSWRMLRFRPSILARPRAKFARREWVGGWEPSYCGAPAASPALVGLHVSFAERDSLA
jgi:hypothetical protein